MGPIDCPETSVRNYHCSLRNSAEERSSQPLNTSLTVLVSRSEIGPLERQAAMLPTGLWLLDFISLFGFYILGPKSICIRLRTHGNLNLANFINSSGLKETERGYWKLQLCVNLNNIAQNVTVLRLLFAKPNVP